MSADAVLQLGAALAGRYDVDREIGAGGMATVYLARDVKHNRKVALKVLRRDLAAVLGVDRFLREIQVTANLQHPNILPLFDSGEADGLLFYVMPFVEGESLRARLERETQLPIDEAIRITTAIAHALDHAHSQGVVHRDLKPENILMQAGQPVIADFGIALAVSSAGEDRLTATGLSLGTPQYMSPEQATGDRNIDRRTDIYSLGAIAYELLAGEAPHTGATAQAVVARLLTEPPRMVTAARPTVPEHVGAAVMRALAKVPADRFGSAREFADALAAHATPARAPSNVSTAPRTWRVAAFGALAIAAAATAVAVWRSGAVSDAIDSVAVLPFVSVGGDTANAYFAEGMADELSAALAKVGGVRVAARTSAAAVSGMKLTISQIGQQLDVRAVITGTVRRAGDRMRVTAELASVATNATLWDSTYERSVTDVFALQDELTRAIVGALRLKLATAAASGPGNSARGTADLEAYDLYLRGMHFYHRRGRSLPMAIESFQLAIARDSSFTRAWAALTLSLLSLSVYDPGADEAELARRAESAAQRAVRLDSTSSDAYVALGRAFMIGRKWHAAGGAFEKAIALDPASSLARHQFGFFLLFGSTQYRRGLDELRTAVRLDPLNVTATAWLGLALILNGRAEEAIPVAQKAVDIDSLVGPPQWVLMYAQYLAGHAEAARATAQRARQYANNRGVTAYVLARTGDVAGANDLIHDFESMPAGSGREMFLGTAYLGLRDTARALRFLENAAERAMGMLQNNFGQPMFDELRGTARFGALMRAYGLDDRVLNSPRGGRP